MSRRAKQPRVDHKAVGEALRANPGVWMKVGEYRNANSADDAVRYIRYGRINRPRAISRWYQPAGQYETRTSLTEGGTLVEARYLPRRRTPPVATALAQTDAARVTGQIERGEVLAGPEGARRIAARHEDAYGDVWATDADRAWTDAINDITKGSAA